jgi:uncharacterized repeat protein (TIGR02543 family)
LNFEENQLSAVDISANTALTTLFCDKNQLNALDISTNTALEEMSCRENHLTALDLSGLSGLTFFNGENQSVSLTMILNGSSYSIDTTLNSPTFNNGGVTYNSGVLSSNSNTISSTEFTVQTGAANPVYTLSGTMEFSYLTGVANIVFADPNFKAALLAITGFNKVDDNDDGEISFEEAAEVASVNVNAKNITSMEEIKYFTNLASLYCNDNQLTALDVSQNSYLYYLSCQNNQLTTLDVTQNGGLIYLYVQNNKLTTLLMKNGAGSDWVMPEVLGNNDLIFLCCDANILSKVQSKVNSAGLTNCEVTSDCTQAPVTSNNIVFVDPNFKQAVIDNYFDTNNDGEISYEEAAIVTVLDLYGKSIFSLEGIEFFSDLRNLYCGNNQLTSLDVSQNSELRNLYCDQNQLTELDVSQNSFLKSLNCKENQLTTLDISQNGGLDELYCNDNELVSLYMKNGVAWFTYNFSGNPDLVFICCDASEVANVTAKLENPNCEVTTNCSATPCANITFADPKFKAALLAITGTDAVDTDGDGEISECEAEAVTTLDLSYGEISSMPEIQYFSNLQVLTCLYNQLTALDLSHNGNLTELFCNNNQLTALDVTQNSKLETLGCNTNQLTSLNISQNGSLTLLDCSYNELTALDLSGNGNLENLNCNNNDLTTLDLSQNSKLKQLRCNFNQLTALDVSGCDALGYLSCSSNQLTALDVTQNSNLTALLCNVNQIADLDLSENSLFIELNAANNALLFLNLKNGSKEQAVYLAGNDDLVHVCCDEDDLTLVQAEVTANVNNPDCEVTSDCNMDADGCNIISFADPNFKAALVAITGTDAVDTNSDGEISECEAEAVTTLNVASKNIASMEEIKYFIHLEELSCASNQLTELDLSQNGELTELSCSYNQLTELDVSQNGKLESLYFTNNQLTALDVSQNMLLAGLDCSNNKLTELDISLNTQLNILNCSNNLLISLYVKNGKVEDMFNFLGNPTLTLICCDAGQLENTQLTVTAQGWTNCEVTTDCSATPCANITFADPNFKAALVAITGTDAVDTDGDGEISECEAEAVTTLNVAGKNIASMEEIKYFIHLEELYCGVNELTELDVSQNTDLKNLYCYDNLLTELDVSQNVNLEYLDCNSNQLTALDVSQNINLEKLYCDNNQLTGIDLAGLGNLTTFDGDRQMSPSIDLKSHNGSFIAEITLNNPTGFASGITYSGDTLASTSIAITASPFTVETGNPDFKLSGTLNLSYPNFYTVTFAGEDINIPVQNIEEDSLAVRPADPERTDYDFGGWFIDDGTFLNEWDFATDSITQDTTLYAKWDPATGIAALPDAAVRIYPNPAKSVLIIDNGQLTINNVTIIDISGRQIFNSQFSILNSQLKLDVSPLPAGFYFIRIETNKGTVTGKFIKE